MSALSFHDLIEQSNCPVKFRVHTRCPPPRQPATGSYVLGESTNYFADNNIVSGSTVTIEVQCDGAVYDKRLVTIEWLAWNEFSWEEVVWGR